jgi:5-formyltetrahydrofolate cyclo-ligase
MNKKELRSFALSLRKTLTLNKEDLENKVLECIKDNKNVAIYYPMKYEIDLLFLRKQNINLLFPKVEGDNLIFYKGATKFVKSKFGVFEPSDGVAIDSHLIDLMFVPCLVINKDKYRIGYGRGYYDRYMKGHEYKTIGICYSELYKDFDEDVFDERLDEIIVCKP